MKKLLTAVAFITALIIAAFISCCFYYIAITSSVKFDESKLSGAAQSCAVFDGDGERVDFGSYSEYVEIKNIPENLKNSFIAIEDKRFYTHNGVDYRSMLRATKNNFFSGKIKEGASTISQQLVKNAFLSGEKTVNRKLCEIKLARQLEKRYSKNEILEMYLNKIYFGNGAYGVAAAAKTYFGKTTEELTLSECATLAAVVKAPASYDPYSYADKCKNRRNLVLKEAFSQGYINESEYEDAVKRDLTLKTQNSSRENAFAAEAINRAMEILRLSSADDLNGFRIYTSVKKSALECISSASDYSLNSNYACVITDNKSGKIIAYKSDIGALKRCPASSAKPWLIYAPALQEKIITEATKILDEKTDFGGYSPSNYGDKYYGFINVKDALCKSLNVPAVKIAESLGSEKIRYYAKKSGVEYTNDDLSVALGNLSGGITIFQLASAYSSFSRGGDYTDYSLIDKIVSPKGKVIYEAKETYEKVFSRGTCDVINDMLYETAKSGTAKKLNTLPFAVCAKTGTGGNKNGNTDAYCVAYTPDYTVVVWLGNADGSVMPNGVSGGTYPAAIARDALSALYKNSSPENFALSDEVVKVKIDKKSYDEKHVLLVSDGEEKTTREFLFIKGSEPTEKYQKEITPAVKTYKITYTNGKILISITADDGVGYTLSDDKNGIKLSGEGSKDFVITPTPSTVYEFYLSVDGADEKIKLPSVKTDGGKTIKDDWWTDD